MEIVQARCCGLDVHQKVVVACVLLTAPDGGVERLVRSFGTMTADLLALADWLAALGVRVVALESTGVYWRPIFNLLETDCEVTLVNARHLLKRAPGHKTDVSDAEWLADLLRHGLVQASCIPPAAIRDVRELTRYRKTLTPARAQQVNRLHKVLEGANIKLAAVASDVVGVSGRAMIEALVGGAHDAAALADLAQGRLRAKLPEWRLALDGRVQPVHRFLLGQILAHVAYLEDALAQVPAAIERRLPPFEADLALAQSRPGVGRLAATVLLAEVGPDMTPFPSAGHLASWAGVCPGNNQSGGKRLSGRSTGGNVWLRAVLGEVAWVIARQEGTYLHAKYHRLARRRGKKRALVAVAHSLLVAYYHVLRTRTPYQDLGPESFEQLDRQRTERHHVKRLQQLGYAVTLTPAAVA